MTASIEGNWLHGGTYTVQCDDQATVGVHDNRFGRSHRSGPLAGCPTSSGSLWDDTGQPL